MKRLRTKMLLAMVMVAVVVFAFLGAAMIFFISNSIEKSIVLSMEPMAESAAADLDDTIMLYMNSVKNTTDSNAFTYASDDKTRLDMLKAGFTKNNNQYISLAILDINGSELISSGDLSTEGLTDEQIDEAMKMTAAYITDIYEFSGKKCFSILCAGANAQGEKLLSVLTVDTALLSKDLNSFKLGSRGFLYVVDKSGSIVVDSTNKNAKANIYKLSDDEEEAKAVGSAILGTDEGDNQYEYNDTTYYTYHVKIDHFNGKVVMVTDIADFAESQTVAIRNGFIIGIIILIITIAFAVFFASRLSKPIISTTNRLRSLAQGNLTDPVDVWYSKDELGVLSTSLEETVFSLRQYISLITYSLTQISEGNLQYRLEGNFKGDFFKIKSTFNEIFDSLNDTFASINLSAEQVNSGAVQVSDYSQAVSQGATQQASAIEELSATLSDVSEQVTQNSEDSKNAFNIVSENTEAVNSCNEDMGNMLKAMNDINTSTSEIAKIIKVIDEIAFQTNILALNAAVEAAREGSKGFGVVADEVRRLASRSAEAARQTAELIENSSVAVSKGSQIAEQTAKSLNEIVEKSNQIRSLIKNISEASETQSGAIAQVNTGVDQISAVVSANTSTAVSTASASEELSSQSLILKNMIARFKLDGEDEHKSSGMRFSYDDDDFDDEPAADDEPEDSEPEHDDEFSSGEDDKY
ncbi:MAG: methyl-accepting chemotaxis protein [Ruminococcus sp.]|nr:methyl-accepting chemotaxis protein [Ruminococcus sp.]